jgi:hypothetical protein
MDSPVQLDSFARVRDALVGCRRYLVILSGASNS